MPGPFRDSRSQLRAPVPVAIPDLCCDSRILPQSPHHVAIPGPCCHPWSLPLSRPLPRSRSMLRFPVPVATAGPCRNPGLCQDPRSLSRSLNSAAIPGPFHYPWCGAYLHSCTCASSEELAPETRGIEEYIRARRKHMLPPLPEERTMSRVAPGMAVRCVPTRWGVPQHRPITSMHRKPLVFIIGSTAPPHGTRNFRCTQSSEAP